MMPRMIEAIRKNRIYVLLVLFILSVNILVFLGKDRQGPAATAEEAYAPAESEGADVSSTRQKGIFDDAEVEERQRKLETLAGDNPHLFLFIASLNLLIMVIILIGVVLDVYLLSRKARGEAVDIEIMGRPRAKWAISDILRVGLIFLSSGYAIVILLGFLSRWLPVLANENFRMVFDTFAMNIIGIGVIYCFIRKKYGQAMDSIGLSPGHGFVSVMYGLAGYVALLPVLVVVIMITYVVVKITGYQPPVQPIVELFLEEKADYILWFTVVFAAVFGPVAEEVFFRGFMYSALRNRFGMLPSMLVTASIFSVLHAHLVGLLPILALGMLLSYLYERTGSIIPSITVHITHNLVMLLLVFVVRSLGV
ncbi:MAG: CPBP family intramembrane metalloprotease [Candidatus Omnitrophica bacterium]|nr:CPBP family intramembrane metalloprotease [Candidatus Omnitrophota bacterium]MDD5487639.1 CPBP family intramembrane metalloprotease [Candidatus Omnitrophota bacterium]